MACMAAFSHELASFTFTLNAKTLEEAREASQACAAGNLPDAREMQICGDDGRVVERWEKRDDCWHRRSLK